MELISCQNIFPDIHIHVVMYCRPWTPLASNTAPGGVFPNLKNKIIKNYQKSKNYNINYDIKKATIRIKENIFRRFFNFVGRRCAGVILVKVAILYCRKRKVKKNFLSKVPARLKTTQPTVRYALLHRLCSMCGSDMTSSGPNRTFPKNVADE